MDTKPLEEPPIAGTEVDTLLGALERNRRTFAWKCGGLDAAGLTKQHPPSTVTLGGLLKHLALVEDDYFTGRLHDRELGAPWDAVDWDANPDWDWESAADDSPEQLMALWQASVERSRTCSRRGADHRRRGSARQAGLAGRAGTEPALHPGRHDRGVRAAYRPRRPHPRVDRWPRRRERPARRRAGLTTAARTPRVSESRQVWGVDSGGSGCGTMRALSRSFGGLPSLAVQT